MNDMCQSLPDEELREWVEALQNIKDIYGLTHVRQLLRSLVSNTSLSGFGQPSDFKNNFSLCASYPGDLSMEEQIERCIRWNALAMVQKASEYELGGHISTYASISTLYEVGFQHFWRAGPQGDLMFFQGHSSPGIYARSFLEGRFDEESLLYFRREAQNKKGLSSYPHPWLMPTYWSFPTVSMGLGPLQAIALARLQKHLQTRSLLTTPPRTIWCFCGDGEMDEPESTSSLGLAGREAVPNLIFIINCNLQRLDGPVRGHGKIIQELDALFGAQKWSVVKLIWNKAWEQLLSYDTEGKIIAKLNTLPDLAFQSYSRFGSEYFKKEFFENDPILQPLVEKIPKDLFAQLQPGAHDRLCVFSAYSQALKLSMQGPVVILAHSIKGYGLEGIAQGFNTAHNAKHLSDQALLQMAKYCDIPLSEESMLSADFYRPAENSPESQYIQAQRAKLGGFMPSRQVQNSLYHAPPESMLSIFESAHTSNPLSSTMALVRVLTTLIRDPQLGKYITPIVADEARTFGMEGLIKQLKIYQPLLTSFASVDKQDVLPYLESLTGQFFQEGINEAGASATWLSCATSYTHFQVPLIPFYTYYSMFGFQRVGDLFWAAGDSLARGFLIGATFGRTALSGEGLQHQDGHSLVGMSAIPNMRCYEPCLAFEMAFIVHYGLSCYANDENIIFYITATNEKIAQPQIDFKQPNLYKNVIQGMYRLETVTQSRCSILASGPLAIEAQKAQQFLKEKYHIESQLWYVTSFTELRRHALEADYHNRYDLDNPKTHPLEANLQSAAGPVIAVSDSWALHADQIARWLPSNLYTMGADGFGRSDTREALREHFEISWRHIALRVVQALSKTYPLESWPAQAELLLALDLEPPSSYSLSS